MGRKKGKQHGEFGSKSMRAAHLSQIQSQIQDARLQLRERSTRGQKSEGQNNSNSAIYKSRIHVGVLRGLLMDRLIEDRDRDAMFRRAISNSSRPREPSSIQMMRNDSSNIISRTGWLISYNYKEALSGIEPTNTKEKVPSLQELCIHVLAPNLQAYINACGKEYIRDCLSGLPASLITRLSIESKKINDDVAYVLGSHSHLMGLVLNANSHNSSYYDEDYVCTTNDSLSIYGLQQLNPCIEKHGVPSSSKEIDWESLHEDIENVDTRSDNSQFRSYPINLERLELHDFHTNSVLEFLHVIKSLKHLSHLSISSCFDSITGLELLLGDGEKESLVDCIPNVHVLDFTMCDWLTYELLSKFAQVLNTKKSTLSLDIVSIQNCCESISESRVDLLNFKTNFRPQFVNSPYRTM
jgi:hypothetical protein